MSTKFFYENRKARRFSEMQCYAVFLFLLSPVVYCIIQSANSNGIVFHGLLFSTGFIVFTFLEYIAHRFWMHGKEEKHPGKSLEQHMHHHRHPTELKITAGLRTRLLLVNVLLLAMACWLDNYFTLLAGFYSGFVYYCFMHVFLHQPLAKKIFPALQVAHIHHHCKYPDRCFSTCITWWDELFNTNVSKEVKISERVLQFYFGKQGH